ncbi:MAG: phage protease [Novosphingobium sp.]|uniref:phage protease n=1 Tax=Novosphingobium sp. TaxID=1874826 RepID=UPI0032B96230
MTRSTSQIALCAAITIADNADVPDWVHLLPAGEIRTNDGRGPYTAAMSELVSGFKAGEKLAIDECHATDRAAPLGMPAPARGWIVELQARKDGLWGRVEWTEDGQALMRGKAYRGISPVIMHDKAKKVLGVLRASLINTPNLVGLTALHSEEIGMDWKAKLIELLGLDGSADDAAISAALTAKMGAKTELCSEDILKSPAVIALQSQLGEVTTELNGIRDERQRDSATAFVDAAIAEGRVGLKPVRDEYIALHMKDADQAKKMIAAMPVLNGTTITADVAQHSEQSNLDDTDRTVMALFGMDEETYAAGLSARGQKKEAL